MDDDPACVVMLASAVSSKMLQAMAQVTSTAPPPAITPHAVTAWLLRYILLGIRCLV